MAGIGEWLRAKVGMSTEEEKKARGEDARPKRVKQIDETVDAQVSGRQGRDAGELGKDWNDTFGVREKKGDIPSTLGTRN